MKTLITNRDIYEEIQKVTKKSEKQKHQVKSRWYYIFWGIATFSVVTGQLYVGSGYRQYARSLNRLFDSISVEVDKDYDDPMIIR